MKLFFIIIFLSANVQINGEAFGREFTGDFLVIELLDPVNSLSDFIVFAEVNGYDFFRKVTSFPNLFIFRKKYNIWDNNNGYGTKRDGTLRTTDVINHESVIWSSIPVELVREKRDFIYLDYEYDQNDKINLRELENRLLPKAFHKQIFNDELWDQQWYLQDTRSRRGLPKLELNVLPVYKQGITGKGVRVAVLDDGLEFTHDDLFDNFDQEISWNCINDNPDPRPDYQDKLSSHGTRCAGEISMIANNSKCGVGIAFNSKIGGIKLLGSRVFDFIEGMALGYAYDKIDIYSSSWGPTDDGKSLERPGYLAKKAIERGIKYGRGGKGAIYVWASGNGGSNYDNCNCDGYAASVYTIAIGSASQRGALPWYSEKCAATLTVTYSSGAYEDQMITTTDINNSCTVRHTGTSASAPLAAGIIALGLEANPNLTWRDVQHIIVNSADYNPLAHNKGWIKNAANRYYNIRFGFGLMNAETFVNLSRVWMPVGIQKTIFINPRQMAEFPIKMNRTNNNQLLIEFDNFNTAVPFLEHAQLELSLDYTKRGVLEIYLESPLGTNVQLLSSRKHDVSKSGFDKWAFTSVGTWSEDPFGVWTLRIIDIDLNFTKEQGLLRKATLILYGTDFIPSAY